jgi:hypothetical protein
MVLLQTLVLLILQQLLKTIADVKQIYLQVSNYLITDNIHVKQK